jgi:lysozyme
MNNVSKRLVALGFSATLASAGAFILPMEGVVNKVYADVGGVLTACIGHTGPELRVGQVFSDEKCLKMFGADLAYHDKLLRTYIKVPITEGERTAYLSLIFNIGPGNFRRSSLLKTLNSGDHTGACNKILAWRLVDGKVVQGLVDRRQKENKLCLTSVAETKNVN